MVWFVLFLVFGVFFSSSAERFKHAGEERTSKLGYIEETEY